MSRVGMLFIVGAATLLLVSSAGGALGVRLTVKPLQPHALEPAQIELRALGGGSVAGLRVQARSPQGNSLRVRTATVRPGLRRGTFRFSVPGRWQVRVSDPTGRRVSAVGARIWVTVRPALPTPPPEGFASLGQPGCNPASPRNPPAQGVADVFGTAVGDEELWALPFLPVGASWASSDAAVFDGLAGKEIKIVFAMTSYHAPFRAVGPGGTEITPVWGPTFHGSSNWDRQPGDEWGAGFVFPEPGCWRIHVGSFGDLWFLIRS